MARTKVKRPASAQRLIDRFKTERAFIEPELRRPLAIGPNASYFRRPDAVGTGLAVALTLVAAEPVTARTRNLAFVLEALVAGWDNEAETFNEFRKAGVKSGNALSLYMKFPDGTLRQMPWLSLAHTQIAGAREFVAWCAKHRDDDLLEQLTFDAMEWFTYWPSLTPFFGPMDGTTEETFDRMMKELSKVKNGNAKTEGGSRRARRDPELLARALLRGWGVAGPAIQDMFRRIEKK